MKTHPVWATWKRNSLFAVGIAAVLPIFVSGAAAQEPTLAANAEPPRPRFSLSLVSQTSWLLDDSNRVFASDRAVGAGGLSLGWQALALPNHVFVTAAFDWQAETNSGRWGMGETTLVTHAFAGSVTLRYAPRWWLRPFARIAGGVARGHAELPSAAGDLTGVSWAPFATGGAGLGIATSPRAFANLRHPLSFALDVEGGFTVAQPFDFTLKVPDNGIKDAIPERTLALGEIGRSRPHLRISLTVGF